MAEDPGDVLDVIGRSAADLEFRLRFGHVFDGSEWISEGRDRLAEVRG